MSDDQHVFVFSKQSCGTGKDRLILLPRKCASVPSRDVFHSDKMPVDATDYLDLFYN